MRHKTSCCKSLINPFSIGILFIIFPLFYGTATAQSLPVTEAETATCKMKVNGKEYQLQPNVNGSFDQISGLQPMAVVPITVVYPNARAGEKVVLTAEQGGSFDNRKQVKVVSLDNEKKCTFTFRVTNNLGLFDILLRKGSDVKVIELWVGKE